MKYYVLEIQGDVEPVLHGSFPTREIRDRKAFSLRAKDPEAENGLYRLNVHAGAVFVFPFGGLEMEGGASLCPPH